MGGTFHVPSLDVELATVKHKKAEKSKHRQPESRTHTTQAHTELSERRHLISEPQQSELAPKSLKAKIKKQS